MREVGKMNWVGESQGCPEAIKAAGIQMACLLETGPGGGTRLTTAVCTSHHQMAMAPSWPSRALLAPTPARVSESIALNRVLKLLSSAQIKEWSYKEPVSPILRNNCLLKGNIKGKRPSGSIKSLFFS